MLMDGGRDEWPGIDGGDSGAGNGNRVGAKTGAVDQ